MQTAKIHRELLELKALHQIAIERADKMLQMIAEPTKVKPTSKTVTSVLAKRKAKLLNK